MAADGVSKAETEHAHAALKEHMSSLPCYRACVQKAKLVFVGVFFPNVTLNMGGKEVQGYFCVCLIIAFISTCCLVLQGPAHTQLFLGF